jgi:hypothetical protein
MDCLWLTVLAICVECPKCLTQYLIGFSPYGNSSYLVPSVVGSLDRYTLYRSLQKSMRSQPLEPGEGLSGLECRLYPWVWNTGGSRACDHPNMEFVVIRHQ